MYLLKFYSFGVKIFITAQFITSLIGLSLLMFYYIDVNIVSLIFVLNVIRV